MNARDLRFLNFQSRNSLIINELQSPKIHLMTYKELLFKMAQVGMLTLSSDKDGRGLFWVGMDNMDALEKEFDWKDFESVHVKEKEYYIDKQGRKMEKHTNYEYVQPLFSEKNP